VLALLFMLVEWNELDQAAPVELTKRLPRFFNSHGDKMTWRGLVSISEGSELSSPPEPSPLELTSLDSLFSASSSSLGIFVLFGLFSLGGGEHRPASGSAS
jgi:hypothetical protein